MLNMFLVIITYLCILFCEVFLKIIWPFKKWVSYLLITELWKFLWISPLHQIYFLPVCGLPFNIWNGIFPGADVFNLDEIQFIIFSFCFPFMVSAFYILRNLYLIKVVKTLSCFLQKLLALDIQSKIFFFSPVWYNWKVEFIFLMNI